MFTVIQHNDAYLSTARANLDAMFQESEARRARGVVQRCEASVRVGEEPLTHTDQAQRIFRDALLGDLDDLSHHHSPLERLNRRVAEAWRSNDLLLTL